MDFTKSTFYVGTSRGVLLSTLDKPANFKINKNDETTEVTCISEGRNPQELILGYQSGNVHVFNTEKGCFSKKIDNLEGDEGIVGAYCFKKTLLLAKRDGVINIWTNKKNDYFSLNLDEASSLDATAYKLNRENVIGTGGIHNDYKLWDIATKQCIFKAKSLGHDHLQLPIPTSVRDITFFNHDPHLGACCTKEGQILLYDKRAQRRPVVKFIEEKASYTKISSTFKDTQIFVGTTKGYLQWVDLKQPSKVLKTYTTFTGSITGVVCDPAENYVASVSLDRHLRVHQVDSKELVVKSYMKQSLTALLVKPVVKDEVEPEQKESNEEVDQEYEELFNNMELVQESKVPKKKRKLEEKSAGVKKKKGMTSKK